MPDGIVGGIAEASTSLASSEVATAASVRVLKTALETSGDAVLALLETLGTNLDVRA